CNTEGLPQRSGRRSERLPLLPEGFFFWSSALVSGKAVRPFYSSPAGFPLRSPLSWKPDILRTPGIPPDVPLSVPYSPHWSAHLCNLDTNPPYRHISSAPYLSLSLLPLVPGKTFPSPSLPLSHRYLRSPARRIPLSAEELRLP